ncbi:hypothetical protein BAMA_14520 [Bacillus manliponensis]|uniref:Transglycosylase n=1 Tax=Bacillus manliponensis TaxID=574376 RepID=A0A073K235_9BACI|nr:hypothetical protein [Bacillus manliponensis]KEK20621.1 hypothetical protein BAMA_14520 [Bacillus manliponensis]
MRSVKCFLMGLFVISQLSMFPVPSTAAEPVEIHTSTTEENEYDQVFETEIGEVTVSADKFQVGETVQIAVKPKNELVTNINGVLQLQKEDHPYGQRRVLSFVFDEQTKSWIASYTVSPYDLGGSWYIYMKSFSNEEKLQEEEINLITIINEQPTLDKEPPILEQILILNEEEIVSVTTGDSFAVEAKVTDSVSNVQEVHMYIEGEGGHIVFPLQNLGNSSWTGTYEVTEALQPGTYELFVEMKDAAGNGTIVSTRYKLIVEQKEEEIVVVEPDDEKDASEEPSEKEKVTVIITEPKETQQDELVAVQKDKDGRVEAKEQQEQKEEETKQVISEQNDGNKETEQKKQQEKKVEEDGFNPSYLFSIVAGLFLLFAALKHNKSWE